MADARDKRISCLIYWRPPRSDLAVFSVHTNEPEATTVRSRRPDRPLFVFRGCYEMAWTQEALAHPLV